MSKKISDLVQVLRTRKSVVVSVDKGRAIVAELVATLGRCHTTCAGQHTWRVQILGAGELRVSVAADAARAEREGVVVALVESAADAAPVVETPRVAVLEQLRAAQEEILAGTPRAARATRQPSRLELEQMRAWAAFGTPRRPEPGTAAYRRLRAS